MSSDTNEPFYRFRETPDGCVIRMTRSRHSSYPFLFLSLAFVTALFYVPLGAAAVFLVEQIGRAPGHLLLLGALFVVQTASVGPVASALGLFVRQCRAMAWSIRFLFGGHHDLEVTSERVIFGERVGSFGNFLNPHPPRPVFTHEVQQIVVTVYCEDQPAAADGTGAKPDSPNPACAFATVGSGELALVEKPGEKPFTYYGGFPVGELKEIADHLYRYIGRGRKSLQPVVVVEKPLSAVRADWDAQVRAARESIEGPMPVAWWQRARWLRLVLALTSVAWLAALLHLMWDDEVNQGWRYAGMACVLVELFVLFVLKMPPGQRLQTKK